MAISLKTAGTWARMVTDGGSVAIPGTPAAGDRMFLFGSWKTFSVTVATPDGWNLINDFSDGSANAGNGSGSVHNAVYYRDWQSGDAAPVIDYSAAPTEGHWVIMLWTKAGGDTWGSPSTATGAIASADPFSVNASTTLTIPNASVVMGLIGLQDDETAIARATDALDDTGGLVTWNGNYVESPATHFTSTSGLDMAGDLGHRLVTTGAAGVTLHMDGDPTAAESGAAKFVVQGLFTSDPQLVTPTTASLTTDTFAPTVTATNHQSVTPDAAALTTATFAPTVTATANQLVVPSVASLTTALFAPTVSAPATATPDLVALVTTTFAPTVSATANVTVTPDVTALTTATFEPTVSATAHQTVTPTTVALVTATSEPSVAITEHQTVVPDPASLVTTGFAPTVALSDHQMVTPTTAPLVLTTFEPGVTGGAGLTVIPSTAALTLASFAPDVSFTDNQLVTPEAASLALTTFAATVLAPNNATPDPASLVTTTFAPTITIGSVGDVSVVPGTSALVLTGFAPVVTGDSLTTSIIQAAKVTGTANRITSSGSFIRRAKVSGSIE